MVRRITVLALLSTLALTGAGASPAAASDETLRAEIGEVLVELQPALTEFRTAARGLRKAKSTARLQRATQGFRVALRRYKWGVVNRKASSPSGLKAKRLLLSGIRQIDIGLVVYEDALEKIDDGASRRSVLRSLSTADKRITAGAEDEADALAALGVTSR